MSKQITHSYIAKVRFILASLLLIIVDCTVPSVALAGEEQISPIPGIRSCFWYRGPFSGDPYINIAYPDSSVFYWAAFFTMPEGAKLEVEGEFAYARYQSLISYDPRGKPLEALADYLIEPDKGSINPYRKGANRLTSKRKYRVEVVNVTPDIGKEKEGEYLAKEIRNLLHAPVSDKGQQILLYRIYLPNKGKNETGGVSLPSPVLTLKDGTRLSGNAACEKMNTRQASLLKPAALGIPISQYHELINQPDKPDTWPATEPPTWHIQLDRKSLIGIYTGEISESARRSEGGFFPNPDNNYVRTIINRRLGPVFVLRGKMPTVPKTYSNNKEMTDGQVRYWSICSNQSFANTRVNDCLFDEEVPLDENGFYTIIVSREADRPRNAIAQCGLAWLPMADNGDGIFDEDVSIIQIRNMLADPNFKHAIQKVEVDGTAEIVMGPYLPVGVYTLPNVVESLFSCPL